MKTYSLDTCPGCGGREATDVDLGAGRHLRRCAACQLTYAPEYADPDALYVDGYFSGEGGSFGINLNMPRFQRYVNHVVQQRVAALERIVGGRGRVLDVGCGTGDFVAALAERGWKAQGVEPIAETAQAGRDRGLDVTTGLLEDSGLPEQAYDLVTAMHVVEHMTDATAFLRLIRRWARPGGHVAVEVPNFRSFNRRAYRSDWPFLRPLEHIVHFTPDTLAATLRRAGLEPVSVRTKSYLWHDHSLDEALADLGRSGWADRLARASRPGEIEGNPVRFPTAPLWVLLRGIERAYDVSRTGMVILAVAQVPA